MRTFRSLLSLLLLAGAMPLEAQITVNVYPREVAERQRSDPQLPTRQRQRFTSALQQAVRRQDSTVANVTTLDSAAIASQYLDVSEVTAIREQSFRQEAARSSGYRWSDLSNDEAADIWPKLGLLPSASVSPGSDRTALFTELAQTLSGGWRFSLATALAVETDGDDDQEESATTQQDGGDQTTDAETGFRRFLAGGGNLSLTATRPLALRGGTFTNQLLYFSPRVWSNLPALSDADAVDDFGGEISAEYQYLRYARRRSTDTKPDLPFLGFQVHTGWVLGTNSFYRTIGHANERMFVYTVPTLNLQFENGVKLGVAYFYAFGDFAEHENLRFQITLSPPKKEEAIR